MTASRETIRRLGHCLWVCALFPGPAHTQESFPIPEEVRFEVGDDRIDGGHIRGFDVTWRATPRAPDGQERASNRVQETVEVIPDDAGPLLRFTQVWYDSLDVEVFTSVRVADQGTMAYRAFHTGGAPGGIGHLDFDGSRVSGFYVENPEGPTHSYALVLEEPVFASFAGLLFAAFPLASGLEGEFAGFGWGGTTNPTLVPQVFHVLDEESVAMPGGASVQAYRVVTRRGAGSELTYWIARDAPYFVRAESHSSNGTSTVFEVEAWTPHR